MAKTFHLGALAVVVVLLFIRGRSCVEHGAPWFLGCYNESERNLELSYEYHDQLTPIYCVRLCAYNESFRYASLRNGSICVCKTNLDQGTNISHALCNVSCHGDETLFCGGTHASSVYSTAVPLLESITVHLPNKIAVNASVNATSELSIKRPRGEVSHLDSITQGNRTAKNISLEWYSKGKCISTLQFTLQGNFSRTSSLLSFSTPGKFSVCVKVFNLFSNQTNCVIVDVFAPVSGLQFVAAYLGATKANISSPSLKIATRQTVYVKFLVSGGSRPSFNIDFGDGSFPLIVVDSSLDPYSSNFTCITASHDFSKCGNFSLNVQASNSISHMSMVLPVKFKVRMEIRFKEETVPGKPCVYTEANATTNVTAKVIQDVGCSVSFEWNFGDDSPIVNTTGPTVAHSFPGTQSRFSVTVAAISEASRKTATYDVCVQERLKGVILEADRSLLLRRNKDIHFTANLTGQLTAAGFGTVTYRFYKGDGFNPLPSSNSNGIARFPFSYGEPGRYTVFVDASNELNRVVSNQIFVRVFDPVGQLSIDREKTTLLRRPTHLVALLAGGTNVTFHWSFGDGLENRTLTSRAVTYVFPSRGKFQVTVVAENEVSSAKASMVVYVTDVPNCYPPKVQILGVHSGSVTRSTELRLEADVISNCSADKELVYSWKVIHNSGPKKSQLAVMEGVILTDQVLIIPSLLLDYGKYKFQLEVGVKDTVLLAEKENKFIEIGESHLMANIAGGTTRVIGVKNNNITLDASGSHDPDFPDERHNIRFSWSCHLLGNTSVSCFNETRVPPNIDKISSMLVFSVDWLLASANAFEFEVTVLKDARHNVKSSQLLYLDTGESHVLSADCLQCDKGNISTSEQLVLTGLCWSCPLDNPNITYLWELYLVGKDDHSEEAYDCSRSKAKENQQQNPDHNNATDTTQPPTTHAPISKARTMASKPPHWKPRFGFSGIARPTTFPGLASTSQGRISKGRVCLDPDEPLSPTAVPTKAPRPTGGGGCVNWPSGVGSGSGGGGCASGSGSGPPGFPQAGSSVRTGYGSGSGGKTNATRPTTSSGNSSTTVSPTTKDINDGDKSSGDMYAPTYTPSSAKLSTSIVGLKRRQMRLPVHQTTTGFRGRNFVLQGSFLKGGNTYMLAFLVVDHNTGTRGISTVFFKTNYIPQCGSCVVTPPLGVALESSFQLLCSNWTDEDSWPLSYHVSYSIEGESAGEEILIYSGYRSVVSFVLPAGLTSFNQRVKVHVTVVGRQGSKRRTHPLNVRVLQPVVKEGVEIEEVLLNETVGRHLSLLLKAGNQQGVRQFSTVLANSLNRLGQVSNVSSKLHLRVQIREELLRLIRNLTVGDKNSALQTCLALSALTDKPSELTATGLEMTSEILQNLGQTMQFKRIEQRDALSQEFINCITMLTSNLIKGTTNQTQSTRHASSTIHEVKRKILIKATETTEKLLKTKLSMQVLGEKPLQVTMPYIKVVAALTPSVSSSVLSLDDVKFQMPENLENQLNGASFVRTGRCFGTLMTVYKENPFLSDMHHTKVSSLSISSCSGQEMSVRNLSREIHISIPHENHKKEERTEEFTLKWKHVNTHTIHRAQNMMNQTLHIHLKLLSKLPPGFDVRLNISVAEDNSSSKNYSLHTSSSFGGVIDLYLGRHQLKSASGAVFAKVFLEDTANYRIKSVKGDSNFSYLLAMQWMGCFYWRKDTEEWLSDGCELTKESTVELFQCRCNHLTSFSGAFVYPPNSLNEHLGDADKLKNSPITLAVVIVIFTAYIVFLVVCVQADKHDKKKMGAVFINDNTTAVVGQKYQISVETGHWFGAGTTANVFVVLHGEDLVSDPLELKCEGKPLFERSSSDVFVVSSQESLGPIWKIHLWHDNKGEQPDWFVERVVVKDVKTGVKWFFDCHRWLAVEKGDGKVDCVLLARSDATESLKKGFSRHSAKTFMDHHLWLSVIGRPSYSRFTRAQRLTCCLSLLLSFLCVNIAWYKPKTKASVVLGAMDVSIETVVVGLLCSLIVLPLNLLWIFLFRYSRRRFKDPVKVYPISEPPTEYTELVTCQTGQTVPVGKEDTVSILDHSLETLLYLKNLGERRRWFPTTFHVGDDRCPVSFSQSYPFASEETVESSSGLPSDGSSLGYNSGQDAINSDQPLTKSHPGSLEKLDFPPDFAPVKTDLKTQDSSASLSVTSLAPGWGGTPHWRFSLPRVFVYVAWFGCLATSAGAGVLTVLYGVSFGWDMSVRWLQSLFFSLLESFFLSQPIMVLVVFLYMACKSCTRREDEDMDEGFEDVSHAALYGGQCVRTNQGFEQDSDDEDVDPAVAVRRRQRYLKFLKPLSKSKLSAAREKRMRSKALWDYTTELGFFVLSVTVTCLLVASIQSPDVYRLNKTLKTTFIRSENSPWNGRGSVKESWKQISKAFNENGVSSSLAPFTTLLRDTQSLLFGRTRITQYKTRSKTICEDIGNVSQSMNVSHRVSNNNGRNKTEASTRCYAKCDVQDGSWMSIDLNQTSKESEKQLKTITESEWINDCTREISVEFTVYTPFLRAISAATLSVKASLNGRPVCRLDLNTFSAFFETAEYGYFLSACKLLFVVLLLYLLQHEFFLVATMSTKYLTSVWRVTQFVTVALASMCVVVYIRWSVCLYTVMREVETESQEGVFYYAKLASWNQEALRTLYSLMLFVFILRLGHVFRLSSTMVHLGRVLTLAARPLVGCMVVAIIFLMAFAHPGYLLFGRLHSAFNSFIHTFLLVSSFFRVEGVSRYQGPLYEEHPLLSSLYFALFLIGCCIVMRGLPAAVVVRVFLQSRKRRFDLLADVMTDFIRNKMEFLMRTRRRKRQRRESDSESDEDEDEDEVFDECAKDAPYPVEYVLDELECQIQELTFLVNNLTGPDLLSDDRYYSGSLSCADSEEDVEYLYPTERPDMSGGSGYESDHSNMSAVQWQLSSSSSHDIGGGSVRTPEVSEQRASSRPLEGLEKQLLAGLSVLEKRVYLGGELAICEDQSTISCSSCYEISGSNAKHADRCEEFVNVERERDAVTDVLECPDSSDVQDHVKRATSERRFLGERQAARGVDGNAQQLSSSSGHSLPLVRARGDMRARGDVHARSEVRARGDREPVKPKALYGLTRGHSVRGQEAFPCISNLVPLVGDLAEEQATEAATNSSSDREVLKKTRRFNQSRRTRALFRSSAVYPTHEGLPLGSSPTPPSRSVQRKGSGSSSSSESGPRPAWGLAPSASERGFPVAPGPDGLGASNSLSQKRPLEGLIGDISMNRKLGTDIDPRSTKENE